MTNIQRYARQSGIISVLDLRELPEVVIVGAGGIGSTSAIAIAKMGIPSVTLVDFDDVEDHNLPNQMHQEHTIGKSKVESLSNLMGSFNSECYVSTYHAKMDENIWKEILNNSHNPIVVMAVDSMKSRREIFEITKNEASFIVDGRMGGFVMSVYAHEQKDFDKYEESLHPDGESAQIPCTERAIIFNTFGIGCEIAKTIGLYASGKEYKNSITRDFLNDIFISD